MDFFEKVGETITGKSKDIVDKAKDLAEIASLRRLYYEQFKEAEYNDFVEQCTAISNAKNGVSALEEKIREIKGV